MPKVCQLKAGQQDCAHSLSIAFRNLYPVLMDGDGNHFCSSNGFMRCGCGAAVRARQIRDWANGKGTKVGQWSSQGTYIIYEYNNIEAGGHVWGIYNNQKYGNGYYDGFSDGDFKHQQIYRL